MIRMSGEPKLDGQVILLPEQGPRPGPSHSSQGQDGALSPGSWEQKQQCHSDVLSDESFTSIKKVPWKISGDS